VPRRLDLVPPSGFRPSDSIDRLADLLAKSRGGRYEYHPDLYPRYTDQGRVRVLSLHSRP
jgi:hypothetical protein